MLILNRQQVRELLSMPACMDAMKAVLTSLSAGRAVQPLRQVMPLENSNLLGLMPGYLPDLKRAGAKIISVFPGNHSKGLPSHQGMISLFDSETGQQLALIDGREITAIRTAAASGEATRHLARARAEVLAILGTGEQARSHLEAMLLVRPVRQVHVWGPTPAHVRTFLEEMSPRVGVPIIAAESVQEAVRDADIICTVTASTTPVLHGEWLKEGVHINAVGACRAADRELDTAAVVKSRLYVDRLESALHEAGDYLIPLAEGAIEADHLIGEIGQVFAGSIAGRQFESEITLFKSLGLAVEDLAAASFLYDEALRTKIGFTIPF
ncbi:ornithine cyclodeaminase family protein [Gorillibacterium timonense]|uniref:ornithine cyclodeaminase family protein n=1 Tax=Gorillibacterium timonense TaxID=1689269 RepID=UPI00071DA0B5|nr:ornithine cyclodeaminase family protein [Gorillibacterium timonense]